MKKLILGSGSVGRLGILKNIGVIPDEIIIPDIDESNLKKETPENMSKRLAKAKALKILDLIKNRDDKNEFIILTGDTVACRGRIILDKASNNNDVKKYLELCSDRCCRVYSSFCIIDIKTNAQCLKTVETRLKIKKLNKDEINFYVSTKDGIGKAGGFTISGFAESFILKIIGSYSNVIGIPSLQVNNALKTFGYHTRKFS